MRLQDSTQGKMLHQTDAEHGTSSDASLENYSRYRFGLAYGRLIYRFRWFIIVLWVAGVIVSVPFAGKLTSVLSGGGFSFSGSESVHVANIITDKLHQPFSQLFVVFQSSGTQVSDPAYQQEANDFANRASIFPHVTGVTTGGTGRDSRTTFVTVNFNTQSEAVEQQLPDFRKLLPGLHLYHHYEGDRVRYGGSCAGGCHYYPLAAGACDDAPARSLELVVAGMLVATETS